MKKRAITSIFIIIVTILFIYLRKFDYRIFDILVYALAILSTLELLKAFGNDMTKLQKIIALTFTVTVFPITVFYRVAMVLYIMFYLSFAFAVCAIFDKSEDFKGVTKTVTAIVYPTIPLLALSLINAFGFRSLFILIMVFATSYISDTGAYLVGSILKGPKLCPSISPKKTISGSIGGIVCGIISSLAVYFVCSAFGYLPFGGARIYKIIIFLILSGIILSIATQVGDLTESYIKRRTQIKDMGNILPGHGGILDRIDGLCYNALTAFVMYSFIFIIF